MRSILNRELAGTAGLELVELPAPEPGACHVRISVEAAGVNFADALMLEGRYQEMPSLPFVPGLEVAGRVDAVGVGVSDIEPGRRVLALVDHGGFAEQVVARADDVITLPEELDTKTAAGFAIAYGTAFGALVWRAGLARGEVLLVHGAAGGVGLTAVECGKALGATVIATARGEERAAVAAAHGADHAIDSEAADLVDRIKALTGGRGVDVVFDPIGGPLFDASLRCIAWEGRIVIIGFASGTVPQIPANILLVKNAAVLGFYWGSYRRHDPERLRAGFRQLFDWYRIGVIRPTVSEVVPLAGTAAAIDRLRRRETTGKLVVDVRR
jgi:NADPH2:quinone reductase